MGKGNSPNSQYGSQYMKQYAVELDGIVLLIFVMYNVLPGGGYSAKKIERALFQTLRALKV